MRLGQQIGSSGPSSYGNGWDPLPKFERGALNAEWRSTPCRQAPRLPLTAGATPRRLDHV